MKIDRDGTKIIIHLPTDKWKREYFLKKTMWVLYHGWIDDDTLYYDTTVFSDSTAASACCAIYSVAKQLGIKVSDDAALMFAEMEEKRKEYELKNQLKRDQEFLDKQAKAAKQRFVLKIYQNGRDVTKRIMNRKIEVLK